MSPGRMMGAAAMALVALVTMNGCTQPVRACTDELGIHLTPQDTTVAAGRAFTPVVALSTCGGRRRVEDTFTFTTTDATVASVDRTTGRITAVGAGQAEVRVTGEQHGRVGEVRVTVSP